MANERFPHLFLPGPSDIREDYRSPRRGGGSPRIKTQDRVEHADNVIRCLTEAWESAQERQAVAHADRNGVYLEFASEPGFDLVLKSLEAHRSGIRLLNVRTEGEDETEITRATVFVPHSRSGHFLRKANAYASEDNPTKQDGTRTPKNATLINSIGDVRSAVLESSFWQDLPERLPGDAADWIEVWLSSEDETVVSDFIRMCGERQITVGQGRLTFPERSVVLILANRSQLSALIELSDDIAEFRAAREVTTYFIEQENRDQVELVNELLRRSDFQNVDQVAILVLDHGINNGHRLLSPVLNDDDCHAVDPSWGTHDHHGHGTLMAGTVAYGDLLECLSGNQAIIVQHGLESAKILPPPPETNPKRLWGYFTAQGISRAEIQAPHRTRIICMAVTSKDGLARGRPSSWSGQVDELASGYSDDNRRLIILSAGNVTAPEDWKAYPSSNLTCEIQDPAQAWNALTVGAFTNKTNITDSTLAGFSPVAPSGGLSPFSSTSMSWPPRKWPIKPEVLFEGGNVAVGPNDSVFDTDDLKLLSTYHDPQVAQFAAFDATSAAGAQAAWMAARIQAAYPNAWPETVRALIVHSANWTDSQTDMFLRDESEGAAITSLRKYVDTAFPASNRRCLAQPARSH